MVNFNIWGDTAVEMVANGNQDSWRVSLMAVLLSCINVHWIIEQPSSSILWTVPHLERTLTELEARSEHTWLGSYGAASAKPLRFWGTADWMGELWARRPMDPQRRLANRRGPWVQGIQQQLADSAAYPPAFGDHVGSLVHRHLTGGDSETELE